MQLPFEAGEIGIWCGRLLRLGRCGRWRALERALARGDFGDGLVDTEIGRLRVRPDKVRGSVRVHSTMRLTSLTNPQPWPEEQGSPSVGTGRSLRGRGRRARSCVLKRDFSALR